MTRRRAHLLFAALTALCAASALDAALRLRQARTLEAAVVGASQLAPDAPFESSQPPALLARALTLSAAGDYERALRAYEPLLRTPDPLLRRTARYDLGNLNLREAQKIVDEQLAKAKTLLELAKQNYRQVLDENPGDWDARYNLERALWLSPERDEGPVDVTPPPPVERPNGDKPDLP